MESILIDKLIKQNHDSNNSSFCVEYKGQKYKGWAIAKPLNYVKEYIGAERLKKMSEEVLSGRAIAVHFTEDEIASGETPSLLLEHLDAQKYDQPKVATKSGETTQNGKDDDGNGKYGDDPIKHSAPVIDDNANQKGL